MKKSINFVNGETLWFVGLYVASRLFLALIPGYTYDLKEFALWGGALLRGENPYDVFPTSPQGFLTLKYPPLFYVASAAVVAAFGTTSFGLKVGLLCFDAATVLVLWRVLELLPWRRDRGERGRAPPLAPLYLYSFATPCLSVWFHGLPEVMALFFLVLGTFFHLKRHEFAAGLSWGTGFMIELYPLLSAFPVAVACLANRRWKRLFRLLLGLATAVFLAGLPFYLTSPTTFAFNFAVHFSRFPRALSLWQFVQPLVAWDLTDVFGVVTLSPVGVTLLGFASTLGVACYLRAKAGPADDRFVLAWSAALYALLPLTQLSLFFRYFTWAAPSICLFSSNEPADVKRLRGVATFTTAVLAAFAAVSLVIWPWLTFSPVTSFDTENTTYWFLFDVYGAVTVPLVFAWVVARRPTIRLQGLEGTRELRVATLLGGCSLSFATQTYLYFNHYNSVAFVLGYSVTLVGTLGVVGWFGWNLASLGKRADDVGKLLMDSSHSQS
ncbi:MAG: hypothetical protein Kow0069_37810 [Promethearchaeota archaeon]